MNEQIVLSPNRKAIENDASKKVLSELEAIINTPLPPVMLDTVAGFVKVISALQGQIAGLCDITVDQEIKIRRLEKTIQNHLSEVA